MVPCCERGDYLEARCLARTSGVILLVGTLFASSGDAAPDTAPIVFFNASSGGGSIPLTWETISEEDVRGFNIYRAEQLDGLQVRLNHSLISAKYPGSHMGAAYKMVDNDVRPRMFYHYWLEIVDHDMNAVQYGPVRAYVSFSIRRGTLTRARPTPLLRQIIVQP